MQITIIHLCKTGWLQDCQAAKYPGTIDKIPGVLAFSKIFTMIAGLELVFFQSLDDIVFLAFRPEQ